MHLILLNLINKKYYQIIVKLIFLSDLDLGTNFGKVKTMQDYGCKILIKYTIPILITLVYIMH